jgi:uncharacterized membrane protein
MTQLLLGLALFSAIHFVPVFARGPRDAVIAKVGKQPYRGLYSLIVVASLYLIYLGWTGTMPEAVYTPPTWAFHITPLFVLAGFILFFASRTPSNIRRALRHPQLMGVSLWAVGHLLANGEQRSILLFGGMLVWAQIMIAGTNQRDGEWIKIDKQPRSRDIVTVAIGLVLFAGFAMIHEWLIGVRPFP